MYINEFDFGTMMNITATVGHKSMEFASPVVKVPHAKCAQLLEKTIQKKGFSVYAIVRAIYLEDRAAANFVGEGIRCSASGVKSEKMYMWHGVQIIRVVFPEIDRAEYNAMTPDDQEIMRKGVHVICSDSDVKSTNRRGSFRLWLGLDGLVRKIGDSNGKDVIIKDISTLGISFILDKKFAYALNDMVYITFNDKFRDGDGKEQRYMLRIPAVVVRRVETEDGDALYGCKMNAPSEKINRYIYQKQIQKLKMKQARIKL